jgi:glycosyltransferase involved in cell wall biosynthesis
LVPGGGERYLLGAGLALRNAHPTAVVTPDEYSAARLNTLMRDLGYPTYKLFSETERKMADRDVDSFVLMGNELLPTRPGYGAHRVFHCQFPFPTQSAAATALSHRKHLASYQSIVVNSAFTQETYQREISALGIPVPPIHVIHPPVRLLQPPQKIPDKENLIVSIGRFSPHGHSKRQDIVLGAFSRLSFEPSMRDWRLVLCGVVPNDRDSIEYYEALRHDAKDCNCEIILAPSRAQLEDLLWRAKIYVSATGFGVRKEVDFWKCEHFGITVVEAASAGCVPLVYEVGGPTEIVDRLGFGLKFGSVQELARRMVEVREMADNRVARDQLIANTEQYSESLFFQRWGSLLSARP